MSALVAVTDWLSLRGDEIIPASLSFIAVERQGEPGNCRGCVFSGQRHRVCVAACELAVRCNMPDFDSPTDPGKRIIYVAPPHDPRQSPLF